MTRSNMHSIESKEVYKPYANMSSEGSSQRRTLTFPKACLQGLIETFLLKEANVDTMADTKGVASSFTTFTFFFLFILSVLFCGLSLLGINNLYKTDFYDSCVYAVENNLTHDPAYGASKGINPELCPGLLVDMKFANIFFLIIGAFLLICALIALRFGRRRAD
jgi:hypothetical protein